MPTHDDDEEAIARAFQYGVANQGDVIVEIIVDVMERAEPPKIQQKLLLLNYKVDVWDDPVDGSVSVYVKRHLRLTAESMNRERSGLREALAEFTVTVEDWGVRG